MTIERTPIMNIERKNSLDQDEVAHHEPPHLDLHCLSFQYDTAWMNFFC